ncbi:MAG TPA: TerB family tellurite resistance protein [Sphingomonadales bacterium]|nr:TerB family tellurite resistance protein [Sphingomonadales bacterium]
MSIWGKIIGGAAGFALGGPLGALLGAAAGHALDSTFGGPEGIPEAARQVAFTAAVIALSAKMAKVDGRVTREEVNAFKEAFRIPPEEAGNVGRVFDRARQSAAGFEAYAAQAAQLFRGSPAVLEDLLGALFHIARADGVAHPAEMEYLERVAQIFGFSQSRFEHLKAQFLGTPGEDPYSVLGLSPDVADSELKSAYRKLIKEHHPDGLIAKGLPPEFVEVANAKLAAINAAYDTIAKERGLT